MSDKQKNPCQIPDFPQEAEYPVQLTDQYELLEMLSEKNDSQTLLIRRKKSGELFVAKCYSPENPVYDKREPESLRKLDSPLLPSFVDEFQDEHCRCVVREYVPGENLAQCVRERSFSDQEIIRIGEQLCEQLSLLHRLDPPVIHRDIKPENVILRPDGNVMLIDFGIAREYSRSDGVSGDTVALGTKGFAPPEQYGFSQTDERSDLYALGMLLAYLRSGGFSAELPKDRSPLGRFIRKCCSFDPSDRFHSAAQARQALKKASSFGSRGWVMKRAGLCLTAVAAAAAVCFFYFRGKSETLSFQEPLVEECVRLQLSLEDGEKIPPKRLEEVKGLYIVADQAYADEDAFYQGINQLYGPEGFAHGEMDSLEDLAMLPQVTRVCIAAEALTKIDELGSLEQLEKLEVKHNYIEDISILSGMEHLVSVGINDNPVEDISPLRDCPDLAFLDLCDVASYDVSAIRDMGDFQYLDISNPTKSYSCLDGKNIRALRAAWTSLSSLEDLEGITGLEELDISHTTVTDLKGLAVHSGLKKLNLSALRLTDLSELDQLPQLETVILSQDMETVPGIPEDPAYEVIFE